MLTFAALLIYSVQEPMKKKYATTKVSFFRNTLTKNTFQFLRLVESHYDNLPFITDVIERSGGKKAGRQGGQVLRKGRRGTGEVSSLRSGEED